MGEVYIPEPYNFELVDAIHVESTTLVGFGNCFSVMTADGKYYDVVNFYHEALEDMIKAGVTWPFKISPIGPRTAVMHDARIPDDKYNDRFCEVCTPMDLLPITQRLRKSRDIQTGRSSFMKCEATKMFGMDVPEMIIESVTINFEGSK